MGSLDKSIRGGGSPTPLLTIIFVGIAMRIQIMLYRSESLGQQFYSTNKFYNISLNVLKLARQQKVWNPAPQPSNWH